jgi:hypothetical protein
MNLYEHAYRVNTQYDSSLNQEQVSVDLLFFDSIDHTENINDLSRRRNFTKPF